MNKFERVYLLLSVAEAALKFPELKPLHDQALAELRVLAAPEPAKPEPTKYEPRPESRLEKRA